MKKQLYPTDENGSLMLIQTLVDKLLLFVDYTENETLMEVLLMVKM